MQRRARDRKQQALASARFRIEPLESRILLSADPVLLIPGIGGSFVANNDADLDDWYTHRGLDPDDLVIDPLANTYADIIQTLRDAKDASNDNVYTEGENFFVANWDWRTPVGIDDGTADGTIVGALADAGDGTFDTGLDYFAHWLRQAAIEAFDSTGETHVSVDVIAHSTGGLIARSYIQSDLYGSTFLHTDGNTVLTMPDIDDLVLVGVPNEGAAEIFNLLLDDFSDGAASRVLGATIDNAWDLYQAGVLLEGPGGTLDVSTGSLSKPDFVAAYVGSLPQLLPTGAFLDLDNDSGTALTSLDSSDALYNSFLRDLNTNVNDGSNGTHYSDALINTTVVYSSESDTVVSVSRRVGPDPTFGFLVDEILSFTDYLGRSPGPVEIWFHNVDLANAGDGTVPTTSANVDFASSTVEITAALAGTVSAVGHARLMSDVYSQQQILAAIDEGDPGDGDIDFTALDYSDDLRSSEAEAAFNGIAYGIIDPIEALGDFEDEFVAIFAAIEGNTLLNTDLPLINQSIADLVQTDFISFFQNEVMPVIASFDFENFDFNSGSVVTFDFVLGTEDSNVATASFDIDGLGSVNFGFDAGITTSFSLGIDLSQTNDIGNAIFIEDIEAEFFGRGTGNLTTPSFMADWGLSGSVGDATITAFAAANLALISGDGDRRLTPAEILDPGLGGVTFEIETDSNIQAVVPVDLNLAGGDIDPVIFFAEWDLLDGSFDPEVKLDANLEPIKNEILDALESLKNIALDSFDFNLPLFDIDFDDFFPDFDLEALLDFHTPALEFLDLFSTLSFDVDFPDFADLFDGISLPDLGLPSLPTFGVNLDIFSLDIAQLEALMALLDYKFDLGLDIPNIDFSTFDIKPYLPHIGILTLLDIGELFDGLTLPDLGLPTGFNLPDFSVVDFDISIPDHLKALLGLLNYKFDLDLDIDLSLPEIDFSDFLPEIALLTLPDFDIGEFLPKFQLALGLPDISFADLKLQLAHLFSGIPTLGSLLDFIHNVHLAPLFADMTADIGIGTLTIVPHMDFQNKEIYFDLIGDIEISGSVDFGFDENDFGLGGDVDLGFGPVGLDIDGSGTLGADLVADFTVFAGAGLTASGVNTFAGINQFDASITGTFSDLDLTAGISLGGEEIASAGVIGGTGSVAVTATLKDEQFEDGVHDLDNRHSPTDLIDHITLELGSSLDIDLPVEISVAGVDLGDLGMAILIDDTDLFNAPAPTIVFDGFDEIGKLNLFSFLTNPTLFINGIDTILGGVENLLNGEIFNLPLPFIGDTLKEEANVVGEFRADVKSNLEAAFTDENGDDLTPEDLLKKILFNAFTVNNLQLLVDSDGNRLTDYSQIELVTGDESVEMNLRMGDTYSLPTIGVDFGGALPGLGLDIDASITPEIGYSLDFGFGYDLTDGFYLVTSNQDELEIFLDARFDQGASLGVTLGFLDLDVDDLGFDWDESGNIDSDEGSGIYGAFKIDISDPGTGDDDDGRLTVTEIGDADGVSDYLSARLEASAIANLDGGLSLGSSDVFPSINTNFFFQQDFQHSFLGSTTSANFGSAPTIKFLDTGLNLGSFISDFAKPLIDEIDKVTAPIQPILDIIDAPIPVISDLAGDTSLIDLAQTVAGGRFNLSFLDALVDLFGTGGLVDQIAALPANSDIIIPFGDFIIGGDNVDLRTGSLQGASMPSVNFNLDNALDSSGAGTSTKTLTKKLSGGPTGLAGLAFPILSDPSNIFGVLTGKTVDLFTYTMPELVLDFSYTRSFPIFPGLNARLGGGVDMSVEFGFGFDTYGLNAAFDSGNPADVFQGFYLMDFVGPNGEVDPELEFGAEITAGASLGVAGLIEAGVEGGIFANVDFDLHDSTTHDGNDSGDGFNKVRGDEFIERILLGPLCVFDTSGSINAGLSAFLWIGLDLGFFGKITIFDESFTLVDIELASFNYECPPVPTADLADLNGSTLRLNFTEGNDNFRVVQFQEDGKEYLKVFSNGLPHREIAPANHPEDYMEVVFLANDGTNQLITNIEGFALGGDDAVFINDTVSDAINVTLRGQGGNDILNVDGGGIVDIDGGIGNDQIKIGPDAGLKATAQNRNILRGGDGDDVILGSKSFDKIEGGTGDDLLLGFEGEDTIFGGSENSAANSGDDRIDGGTGNDSLFGGDEGASDYSDPNNIVRHGDQIYGGAGNDNIEGGAGDDALYGADGTDRLIGGAGDDYFDGGEGVDELRGNAGSDSFEWFQGDGADTIFGGNSTNANGQDQDRIIARGYNTALQNNILVPVDNGTNDNIEVLVSGNNVELDFSGISLILDHIEDISLDSGDGSDYVLIHDLNTTTVDDVDVSLSAKRTVVEEVSGEDTFTKVNKGLDTANDTLEILGGSSADTFISSTQVVPDPQTGNNTNALRVLHNNNVSIELTDSTRNHDTVIIQGGTGDDVLVASGVGIEMSKMRFFGNEGDDVIVGTPFNDYIDSDIGDDAVTGGEGVDIFVDAGGDDTLIETRDEDMSLFDNLFVVGEIRGDDGGEFFRNNAIHEQGLDPVDPRFPAPVTFAITDDADRYAGGAEVESLLYNHNPMFENAILVAGASNNILVVGDRDGEIQVGNTIHDVDNWTGTATLDNGSNEANTPYVNDNEYYIVHLSGTGGAIINIADNGSSTSFDELFIYGTDGVDNFHLDSTDVPGEGLVNSGLDEVFYRNIQRLTINTLDGNDTLLSDDTRVQTVIYTSRGDDDIAVGTVPQIFDTENPTIEFPYGVPIADISSMTNGNSAEMIIYGGEGDDEFEVNHNVAKLYLHGGDHDDTFTINTFLVLKDNPEEPDEITNLINLFGSKGSNRYSYLQNAPVYINGGDGIDTLVINGTPIGDNFVVTDSYVAGAGRINYFTEIERLEVNSGGGQDEIWVLSTSEDFELTIRGGSNDDIIHLGGEHPPLVFDPPEFIYQPPSFQVQDPGIKNVFSGAFDPRGDYFYFWNLFDLGDSKEDIARYYIDRIVSLYAAVLPDFRVTNYSQVLQGTINSMDSIFGLFWFNSWINIPTIEYTYAITVTPDPRTVTPPQQIVDPPPFAFKDDAVFDVSDIRGKLTIIGGEDFETDGDSVIVHNQDAVDSEGGLATVVEPVYDGGKFTHYRNGASQDFLVDPDGKVYGFASGGINDDVILLANLNFIGTSTAGLTVVTELREVDIKDEDGNPVLGGDGSPETEMAQVAVQYNVFEPRLDDNNQPEFTTYLNLSGLGMGTGLSLDGNPYNGPGLQDLESIDILFGDGDDVFTIEDTHEGYTRLVLGGGDDTVNVMAIRGLTDILGGAGNDTVNVHDASLLTGGVDAILNIDGDAHVEEVVTPLTNASGEFTDTLANAPLVFINSAPGSNGAPKPMEGAPIVFQDDPDDPNSPIRAWVVVQDPTTGIVIEDLVHERGVQATNASGQPLFVNSSGNPTTANTGFKLYETDPSGALLYLDGQGRKVESNTGTPAVVPVNRVRMVTVTRTSMVSQSFALDDDDNPFEDSIIIKDTGNDANVTNLVTSSTFSGDSLGANGLVNYTNTEFLDVFLGSGDDELNIQSTIADTLGHTGEGDDTINISSDAPANNGTLDLIEGDLTVDGGADSNTLNISDKGDDSGDTATLTEDSLTGMSPADIFYMATGGEFDLGDITIEAGSGGNDFTIESTFSSPALGTLTTLYTGTASDEVLVTELDPEHLVIHGQTGDDIIDATLTETGVLIYGEQGDDDITGGAGADILFGDLGSVIRGEAEEILSAQTSNNTIGAEDDIYGLGGNDILFGGNATDDIEGGEGDDVILGDHGIVYRADGSGFANDIVANDTNNGAIDNLSGNLGNDIILGGVAGDDISGDAGDDILFGDFGTIFRNSSDQVEQAFSTFANAGDSDVIGGDAGDDLIVGGAAGDELHGNDGDDVVFGDNGILLTTLAPDDSANIVAFDSASGGGDSITGDEGDDILIGGFAGDDISGNEGNDIIFGDYGTVHRNNAGEIEQIESTFTGIGGDDGLDGNDGNDILFGGFGSDELAGHLGDDLIFGDNGIVLTPAAAGDNANIVATDSGNGANDSIEGNAGNDILIGGHAGDSISGNEGDDIILGDYGSIIRNDVLDILSIESTFNGVGGDDDIAGNDGNDMIIAGAAADDISGNAGNDIILGDNGVINRDNGNSAANDILALDTANGGNDDIDGDEGSDILIGGFGEDRLFGSDEASFLSGLSLAGDDADIILGDYGTIIRGGSDDVERILSTITSFGTNDVLIGGLGGDILIGGSGTDEISGNTGDDVIVGDHGIVVRADGSSEENDVIAIAETQGAGDILQGNEGNDIVIGGLGNDLIFGDSGEDIILGDYGTVIRNSADVVEQVVPTFTSIGGNDELSGGDANDLIIGGAGADGITGGLGDDIILGDNGEVVTSADPSDSSNITATDSTSGDVDTIYGNEGNDLLVGGLAGDFLYGNEGNDLIAGDYAFINRDNAETVLRFESIHTAIGGDDTITGDDGADMILGGAGADGITGDLGADILLGDNGLIVRNDGSADANDIIATDETQGGIDTINGNDGADIILGGLAGDILGGNAGDDIILGDFGSVIRNASDETERVESTFTGIGGDDSITGDNGDDMVLGGAGADGIDGNLGADILLGDNGLIVRNDGSAEANDIIATDETQGGIDTINGNDGADIILGGLAGDILGGNDGDDIVLGDYGSVIRNASDETERVESTFTSIGGDDNITGDDGEDILIGGAANDTMSGDADDDILLGDNGIVYRNDGSASANDVETTDEVNGGVDTMTGDTGNDLLIGGQAGDFMDGNDGDDILLGDYGVVVRNASDAVESITSAFDGIGGNDDIEGNAGDDLIIGGTANDLISGNEGNDTILGDNGRIDFAVDANLATLDIVNTTSPELGGDDTISGDVGSDLIFGGTGSDTISGGDAYDLILGDQGIVDYALPLYENYQATDTTNALAGASDLIYGGAGGDIILGQQGDDTIYGDSGDDDIIGGHNVAAGLDGSDRLDGGAGNDVIAGDNATVVRTGSTVDPRFRALNGSTIYDANLNLDVSNTIGVDPRGSEARLIFLFDTTIGASADTYGDDDIAGGSEDDTLFGQAGNDTLQGDGSIDLDAPATGFSQDGAGDGDDYIEGNIGADVIFGNQGQDDLIGGSSSLFSLVSADLRDDSADTIFGGSGTDLDRFSAGAGHADDADVIVGDNGNIFRLTGLGGTPTSTFLSFTYDKYSATVQITPRGVELLDYDADGVNDDIGGADTLVGEAGDDVIYGAGGNDFLYGGAQDDQIYGQSGNDWISGGTGDDGILGDDGIIFVSRNGSSESLFGISANSQGTVTANGQYGDDIINASGDLDYRVDLEAYDIGGDDMIYGGLGNDNIHAGAGNDAVSGSEALNNVYLNPASVSPLIYDEANRVLDGYDINNPLKRINGHLLNFDAFLNGSIVEDGDDVLFGDLGHDWLVGGTGNDHLWGGLGDDILNLDDNLDTTGGANQQPDDDYAYRDIAFGGGGLDRLLLNHFNDRAIDWRGEFNSYVTPNSQFGAPAIIRAGNPAMLDYLYALSAADGADLEAGIALGGDPARNGEPYGEIGLVENSDDFIDEQTGAPSDPQPGNNGGGGSGGGGNGNKN